VKFGSYGKVVDIELGGRI